MKTIVEYGVRGGACADQVLPSVKKGQELASRLAWVLSNGSVLLPGLTGYWRVTESNPRVTWQSETHFVALTILDGIPRGPAASGLRKLP